MSNDIKLPSEQFRSARYHEGPQGRKDFMKDMKKDPARLKEWKEQTELHKDEFEETMESYEEAMWAKGEDVPLDKLPEELQENVENPPPGVQALREKMENGKAARQRTTWRAAAGGLYGYTKGTQRDVEASVRKAQRRAASLAKALLKDAKAADFLGVHAKRAGSKTARLLRAAMRDALPKIASTHPDSLPVERAAAEVSISKSDMDTLHKDGEVEIDGHTLTYKEASSEKAAGGLYGFPAKTARAALAACTDLRAYIGEVAYDLHSRRMAKHDRITGFLKEHSKTAKCGYARLLLDTYPEAPRLAAKKKLPDELKKHQFTKDDNPNPKGNDKDGDGKSGEKPDFLKEIEDKKGKKASLRRAARRHFAGRRYDYDEVIDFLTDDKSTPELERMWKKWSAMVEDLHDRWFEGWAEANAPELLDESIDYKELAWKAFGSVTGMGIGLWEGDFLGDEHDEAFEKVVERDSKVSRFGQDLDDEISMAREGDGEESMRMASRRKSASGNHHVAPNGDIFVDTAFLNATNRIPGVTLGHMGFGEFYADTPKGRVDFDRMRGKDFPGQSGRSHKLYGEGNAADWLLDQMIRKGQSVESGSRMAADQMLRKAFVPDSVDGWLEWEDGTRTATRKTAMTPYEKNQKAMLAEAGDSLKRMYDPAKLAQAIVKMRSFKKMVGSSVDMVKDALIALEEGGAIRRLDDDLFFQMRDEVERLMFPRRRASTRRRG